MNNVNDKGVRVERPRAPVGVPCGGSSSSQLGEKPSAPRAWALMFVALLRILRTIVGFNRIAGFFELVKFFKLLLNVHCLHDA